MSTLLFGGNWTSPLTWSGLRAPQNDDTLTISAIAQVTVNNINAITYTNLCVKVYGDLYFATGQKIYMCPGSVSLISSGLFSGGSGGSKIIECGNTVWSGPGPTSGGGTYGNSTLPVELVSFTATQAGEGVEVSWATASEINNSHFTISRSADGVTFEELGRVTGNGSTTQPSNYVFQDDAPASGTSYYRLTQTDFNGLQEILKLAAVDFSSLIPEGVLTVFPNPCQGKFTVNLSASAEDESVATLELLNAAGMVVYTAVAERNAQGGYTLEINADNNLAPGIYFARSLSAKNVLQQKVVIK
ncbi:MAG TPA: T9SS type A sorting domain-containing protein [Bacteroidia bacterium]|nr:T9SS type A sorting domain-containing protein [Bacteroidia bacterium]